MEQSDRMQASGEAADATDLRAIEWELVEVIRRLEILRSQVHDLQFITPSSAAIEDPKGAL